MFCHFITKCKYIFGSNVVHHVVHMLLLISREQFHLHMIRKVKTQMIQTQFDVKFC